MISIDEAEDQSNKGKNTWNTMLQWILFLLSFFSCFSFNSLLIVALSQQQLSLFCVDIYSHRQKKSQSKLEILCHFTSLHDSVMMVFGRDWLETHFSVGKQWSRPVESNHHHQPHQNKLAKTNKKTLKFHFIFFLAKFESTKIFIIILKMHWSCFTLFVTKTGYLVNYYLLWFFNVFHPP